MAVFQAEIKNGKTVWYDPQHVVQFIAKLEGARIIVTIEKWRGRRSDQANRFYWGAVVDAISEHTGYEKSEVHSILGMMFLLAEKDGRKYVRSTATLNTAEFSEFLDRVIRWAAMELGVVISDPR
jgi:CRISPR/Cas system CSM-associated protein Csm2 small subunit